MVKIIDVITLVQVAIYKESSVWITRDEAAHIVESNSKK